MYKLKMTHYVIKFYYRLKDLFTNKSQSINAGKRQRCFEDEDEDDEYLKTTFQRKRTKWNSDPVSPVKMATGDGNGPLPLPKPSVERTRSPINTEMKENAYDLTSDDDDIEDITPIRDGSRPPLSPLPGRYKVHPATRPTRKENHPSSTPFEQNGDTSSKYLNNGRISAHLRLSQKSGSSTSSMGTRNHVKNSALNESIRLEEKMRYSDLLNTFLHERNLPSTVLPNVELPKPISLETHIPPLIQKYRHRRSPAVHMIDLTKDVDAHIPVQKSNEPCQNRNNVHQKMKIVRVNSFEDKIKSYGFLGPQWISDMQSKYGAREREKRREMDEALLVKDLYEKHNKGFTDALSERIRKHLAITEVVLDETKEDIPTLPTLTLEMEKRIKEAYIRIPPNEVVATGFGQRITRKDICTLANLHWLNDEVINFYMNLLIERGKNDNLPNVFAFNTFFYPKLISGGHSALKRWTKKVDIFAQAMVIVPIHLGMHWCLAVIDFRDKTARYYDSMGSFNNKCLNALMKYLEDESLDKKKQPFDTSDWKLENVRNIPQQMNGSDCGMFSCMFAEFLSRNASITFTQDDMPYFRRKMTYEILTGKLLT